MAFVNHASAGCRAAVSAGWVAARYGVDYVVLEAGGDSAEQNLDRADVRLVLGAIGQFMREAARVGDIGGNAQWQNDFDVNATFEIVQIDLLDVLRHRHGFPARVQALQDLRTTR